MFERITVVIAINSKKVPLFTVVERLEMATEALAHLSNVEVAVHDGLVVDFANDNGADVIVRGIRAVSDFEYEFQIALMNRKLHPGVATIFLMPHEKYTYLNSSIIRELARYQQDLREFVPAAVAQRLVKKFQ